MEKNIIKQLTTMVEINKDQKKRLCEFVMGHPDNDPILRHDIMHHCLLNENIPEQFENETDFDFGTRIINFRRRIDEQNRLAGCILMLLEKKYSDNTDEIKK